MKVISNTQLTGEYGTVGPDQVFEPRDAVAEELLRAGRVRKAQPPVIEYETQVIEPEERPEVRPELPFRHLRLSDEEPEDVAAAGDRVLSEPDAPPDGASDRLKRRGRARFGAS